MEQTNTFEGYLEILKKKLNILPDKSEEDAYNTLCALWHRASGNHVSPIAAKELDLPVLIPEQLTILEGYIQSRLSGVPLAHLTDRQDFMGLDFILKKGLYIPRKETELLAKITIDSIKNEQSSEKKVTLIDLCTGIGTVAIAVSYYCENTFVYGSDIYKPAIEAALINTKHFDLEHRATFYNADLFDPFDALKGNIGYIVSAPPYIASSKVKHMATEISEHEPEEAFDAGPFGLSIFNKLISTAPEYLSVNGTLIFECGLGQGPFLSKRIKANKRYGDVSEFCDEEGNVRVLKAMKIS